MLCPGWLAGQTSNTVVSLEAVVDHIDHVCQVASETLVTRPSEPTLTGASEPGAVAPTTSKRLQISENSRSVEEARISRERCRSDLCRGNWCRFFRKAWETLGKLIYSGTFATRMRSFSKRKSAIREAQGSGIGKEGPGELRTFVAIADRASPFPSFRALNDGPRVGNRIVSENPLELLPL